MARSRALAAEWEPWGIAVSVVESGFGEDQLREAAPSDASHPVALPSDPPTSNAVIAGAVVAVIEEGAIGVVRSLRPGASGSPSPT